MGNLVCFETLEKSSLQLYLSIALPHFPLPHSPPHPRKTGNAICTTALTNPETKISSSHQENDCHPEVPLATGNQPQTCQLHSLPALAQQWDCLWSSGLGGHMFRVRPSWWWVAGTEKPCLVGAMCKPHSWAIIFQSEKVVCAEQCTSGS